MWFSRVLKELKQHLVTAKNKDDAVSYVSHPPCRSLEAHWDTLQDLLLTMSSNGLTLDFIGLTEIFKIQDVLHYKINGYHNLLFNTRLDADDGHGGVGLYISETFTYSK